MQKEKAEAGGEKASENCFGKVSYLFLTIRSYEYSVENEAKNEVSNAFSTTSSDRRHLPKKEQYKKQIIVDKTGTYDYEKDPEGYKKARK